MEQGLTVGALDAVFDRVCEEVAVGEDTGTMTSPVGESVADVEAVTAVVIVDESEPRVDVASAWVIELEEISAKNCKAESESDPGSTGTA
jgi:hypothetical protein